MQTFLPDPDFTRSAQMLDSKRVWKQVLEAKTIVHILEGTAPPKQRKDGMLYVPWEQHPATVMWKGYERALSAYYNAMLHEALYIRGIRTTLAPAPVQHEFQMPPWLGHPLLHASHRSNLLRKDWAYYSQFGWTESTDWPYAWPVLSSAPLAEYYTCYTRPDPNVQQWILTPTQECAA